MTAIPAFSHAWASAHRALLAGLAVLSAALITGVILLVMSLSAGTTTGAGGPPPAAPDVVCPGAPPGAAC